MTIFRPAVSSCLGWHEAALHLHGFRASAGLHINYRMRIKSAFQAGRRICFALGTAGVPR